MDRCPFRAARHRRHQPGPLPAEKLATVTGEAQRHAKSRMTPPYSLQRDARIAWKCDSRLRSILDQQRRCARSTKTRRSRRRRSTLARYRSGRALRPSSKSRHAPDVGDHPEKMRRDAVSVRARDLLSKPHQEHGAAVSVSTAGSGKHRDRRDTLRTLQGDRNAVGWNTASTRSGTGVGDDLAAGFALFLRRLELRNDGRHQRR